jgi:hypothetical protein
MDKLPAEIQADIKRSASDRLLQKWMQAGFDNDEISE